MLPMISKILLMLSMISKTTLIKSVLSDEGGGWKNGLVCRKLVSTAICESHFANK